MSCNKSGPRVTVAFRQEVNARCYGGATSPQRQEETTSPRLTHTVEKAQLRDDLLFFCVFSVVLHLHSVDLCVATCKTCIIVCLGVVHLEKRVRPPGLKLNGMAVTFRQNQELSVFRLHCFLDSLCSWLTVLSHLLSFLSSILPNSATKKKDSEWICRCFVSLPVCVAVLLCPR